jgi:hypothetical protein
MHSEESTNGVKSFDFYAEAVTKTKRIGEFAFHLSGQYYFYNSVLATDNK